MIASVAWTGQQKFEAKSESGHTITFDVAKEAGCTPMEAVLMALCADLRERFSIGHATVQIETDALTACALAPEHVV